MIVVVGAVICGHKIGSCQVIASEVEMAYNSVNIIVYPMTRH